MATADTEGSLALQHEGRIIVELQTGRERYQQLSATRLRAARLAAGWSGEQLAEALTDVLGVAVTSSQLARWEEGAEPYIAGIMPASYDVMGMSEAEMLGLDNPDAAQVHRLALAVARVRALLNDPTALMRRATELLEGTARPLLVVALVALSAFRMTAGPATPGYFQIVPRRSPAITAPATVVTSVEAA